MNPTVPIYDELHETKGNQFKIMVGPGLATSSVELNGVALEGVRRVVFDLNADGRPNFLRLEIYGEAMIEGEYVEHMYFGPAAIHGDGTGHALPPAGDTVKVVEAHEPSTFDRMLEDSIKRHPKMTAHLHESERREQAVTENKKATGDE